MTHQSDSNNPLELANDDENMKKKNERKISISSADRDGNDNIDLEEFTTMYDEDDPQNDKTAEEVFRYIDTNQSGTITQEEVIASLKQSKHGAVMRIILVTIFSPGVIAAIFGLTGGIIYWVNGTLKIKIPYYYEIGSTLYVISAIIGFWFFSQAEYNRAARQVTEEIKIIKIIKRTVGV